MAFGARYLGARTWGDSTSETGAVPERVAPTVYGAVAFAGEATAVFGAKSAAHGAVLFSGTATVSWSPSQISTGILQLAGRAEVVFRAGYAPAVDPTLGREPYRLVVTDVNNQRYGELDNANIASASWVLNGIGELDATVPVSDAKALMAAVPTREVELWRGRQMLWVGPVVRREADGDSVRILAKDLNWYFTRRHVGRANRVNYVQNPSFEQGMKYWSIVSGDPTLPPEQAFPRSVTIAKSPVFDGSRSLRIQMSQEEPSAAAAQSFVWTVPNDLVEGETWTLVAWFYIETWIGPGYRHRGLQIMRASTTETVDIYTPIAGKVITYPKVLGISAVNIDEDTPRRKWVRAEVPLGQPPKAGEPEFIDISVSGIRGTIYWDAVSLTRNEGLHFNEVDQATIVRDLVRHAQDPAFGKSNLNIGTSTPLTGRKHSRSYYFHDHQKISDLLGEWTSMEGGVDTSIQAAPGKRTFHTHFPRKGVRRRDVALELGKNIASFSIFEDGEETANSVIVLGEGDGSDREEGGHIDASALDGLILETVYNGAPGAPIHTLQLQAEEGVEKRKRVVTIPQVRTYEGSDLVGVLDVGDSVLIKIDYHSIKVQAWYRITQIELDPETDQLTLSVEGEWGPEFSI